MSNLKSICVYCGASNNCDQIYKDAATNFGKLLAERNIRLVFGGGNVGLMGLLSQAVMDNGGTVKGVMTQHLYNFEGGNRGITELVVVDTMHERKRMMFEASNAFVILPGGFGTLDEACEIITWKQIQLHKKPIAILDTNNYWSGLFDTFINHMIDNKFVRAEHKNYFQLFSDMNDIIPYLEANLDRGPELVTQVS
jgi:hypothetical protein